MKNAVCANLVGSQIMMEGFIGVPLNLEIHDFRLAANSSKKRFLQLKQFFAKRLKTFFDEARKNNKKQLKTFLDVYFHLEIQLKAAKNVRL